MNKQNELPEDDMLRRFWQESKKEAPEGFSDFIMHNLPQYTPLPEALKKPLLSLKVVSMLTGIIVAMAILFNNLGGSTQSLTPWQQNMVNWLSGSLSTLGGSTAWLPTLSVLAAAVMLLIGLDRLLQRYLGRANQ